jgi:hypothetical protein
MQKNRCQKCHSRVYLSKKGWKHFYAHENTHEVNGVY